MLNSCVGVLSVVSQYRVGRALVEPAASIESIMYSFVLLSLCVGWRLVRVFLYWLPAWRVLTQLDMYM